MLARPREECMIAVRKLLIVVGFILTVSAGSAFGSATNIYITQTGSSSGNCTTNVQTLAFFNSASNWGSGESQIGPGTTVLLCGTFTLSAGSTGLSVQGSGASGNPVVLKFDTNASLQAPYFSTNDGSSPTSGAITISGRNYVLIDGGTACGFNPVTNVSGGACNGTISSTADGTSLTYQKQNAGIYLNNVTGIEIRNIGISGIYLRTGAGSSDASAASGSADVWIEGPATNCSVHDSSLSDSHIGVLGDIDAGTFTTLNIYNNEIAHHGWGINVGGGDNGSTGTGINIYGNEFTNWNNWADANATYHTDGIITYSDGSTASGSSITGNIYNNYFHGDLGGGTGSNAVSYYVSLGVNSLYNVFNNVLDNTGGANIYGGLINVSGVISGSYPQNGNLIANNTLVLNGLQDACIGNNGTATFKVYNNICSGIEVGYEFELSSYSPLAGNYNNFYSMGYLGCNNEGPGPPNCISSLSSWRSTTGQDANSSTGNPLLTTYIPQSGSPVIGLSKNLYSLGITALNSDKAGNPRLVLGTSCSPTVGTAGCWDAGAYEYGSSGPPTPPTSLAAVVH